MMPQYQRDVSGPASSLRHMGGQSPQSRTVAALQFELDKLRQKQQETNEYMARELNLEFEELTDEGIGQEESETIETGEMSYRRPEIRENEFQISAKEPRYQKPTQTDRIEAHYEKLIEDSLGNHIEDARQGIAKLNHFDIALLKGKPSPEQNAGPEGSPTKEQYEHVNSQENTHTREFDLLDMSQLDNSADSVGAGPSVADNPAESLHERDIAARLEKMRKSLSVEPETALSGPEMQERDDELAVVQNSEIGAYPSNGVAAKPDTEKSFDDYDEEVAELPVAASKQVEQPRIMHSGIRNVPEYNQQRETTGVSHPSVSEPMKNAPRRSTSGHKYSLEPRVDDAILAKTNLFGGQQRFSLENRSSSGSANQQPVHRNTYVTNTSTSSNANMRQPVADASIRRSSYAAAIGPQTEQYASSAAFQQFGTMEAIQHEQERKSATQRHSQVPNRILPYHEEILPIAKSPLNRNSSPHIARSHTEMARSGPVRTATSVLSSLNLQALQDSLGTIKSRAGSRNVNKDVETIREPVVMRETRRDATQETDAMERQVYHLERLAELRRHGSEGTSSLGHSEKPHESKPAEVITATQESPKVFEAVHKPDPNREPQLVSTSNSDAARTMATSSENVPELHVRRLRTETRPHSTVQSPEMLNFEIDEQKTPLALNEASMLKSEKLETNEQHFNMQVGESLYENRIFLDQDSFTQYKMDLDWDE